MGSVVDKLQRLGLTEYEARVYLSLLSGNVNSASRLSEGSGVPRTKIYSVLRSLHRKGWIRIYSGVPLLFKAVDPHEVFAKIRKSYSEFLESIQATLDKEVLKMKEKFLIKKFDVGLEKLREAIEKAKTVWINNATTDFLKRVSNSFNKGAEVKVSLFPGEMGIEVEGNIEFREAEVEIVCLVRNRETPSISIILDEERVFTVFKDPLNNRYFVDEMLYDECTKCFLEWHGLSWEAEVKDLR